MHERLGALLGIPWILLWLLASGQSVLAAQGIIRGTILDETGAALPGATVSARNLGTNATHTTTSDARGRYELTIDAGRYEIVVDLPEFRVRPQTVLLAENETHTLDVTLQIAPLSISETVTVTRADLERSVIPNAVSIVESDDIQIGQRRVSPAEALGNIPGLFAANRNNLSLSGGVRLAIRAPMPAVGMRGVQIVQDGIPLTMADGTTQPTNIDLGSAGRIEVLRGPSSVLYGNSAGGVITIQTEFPTSQRIVVEPDFQVGSFGYERQAVKVQGTAKSVGYVVNVTRSETDGFRTNNGNGYGHSDVRQANVAVGGRLTPATELRGVFNYFDLPFGENASTLTLEDARTRPTFVRPQVIDAGLGEGATQGQGGVTLQHRFANANSLRVIGWGMWRDLRNPIPAQIIELDRVGAGFRSEYQGLLRLGPVAGEWTSGLDFSNQRDDRIEYANAGVAPGGGPARNGALQISQFERVRSIAPFIRFGLALRPQWRVTVGARYDRYNFDVTDRFLTDGDQSDGRTMQAVSPMVGLTYLTTNSLNLYANFSSAYQTPLTVELNNPSPNAGGFNPDLEPSTLRSGEVGVRGLAERVRLRYEVSSYWSRLENALVGFQRSDQKTYYRNAGESRRNGLEMLLNWQPVSRFEARLRYTYQHFKFERFVAPEGDFSGKLEPSAPVHQLALSASFEPLSALRSSAQVRWVDDYVVNNANTFSNWAYTVVDVRVAASHKWKLFGARPFFGIDNLFNERYNGSTVANAVGSRFFEPSPGRQGYVGLTVELGE
jgi:iron complex outermembrane receptor protein